MTKEATLHKFFNSFGVPAYPASAVPEDCVFPWITYELTTGSWDDGEIGLTVNIWCYTTDENEPNQLAREMAEKIGRGGKLIACDGGAIWLKRGNPWCQNLTDDTERQIKRRYLNVTAEFLTSD